MDKEAIDASPEGLTSDEVIDFIIERPRNFTFGGRSFAIKPLTLGKTLMLSKYNARLINALRRSHSEPQEALLKICEEERQVVSQIIAVYITPDVESLFNDEYMADLTRFIDDDMTDVQKCTLLQLYYEERPASVFAKHFRLDEEREKLRLANKAKDKSSALTIGGVTIFGNLIDTACERYGWSYQYVLWGISYNVLQTLLADVVQTVYLNDKERARAHINDDGRVLHGERQEDVDAFKAMCM